MNEEFESTPGSIENDELTCVLADYLAAVDAGEAGDPEELIANHPAIAERLRTCLKGLHLVEEFACSIGAGASNAEADKGGPTLGDFRIVRALGRGGMGVVYEAVQRSLERRVALKVLPFGAAIDPRRLARFQVESHAAARLNHPHIVPVYAVGSEAGVHYYAMQLIDGTTLAAVISDLRRAHDGKLAPAASDFIGGSSSIGSALSAGPSAFFREAARLAMQAAFALDHAHENGVLHRDVKPSNLLIDGTGHLWVTDFGLARYQADSSLTVSGDILGTLRYMSPEQALANRSVVDQRTDVYSLGATLYELITLHPIVEGSNRQELLRKIAQDEPRRPRALSPEVPLDLETIVLKAVAKEPPSRYSSARQLALDLERFLSDQPITARRPRVLERLTRLARKHTSILMAVVPLLLFIVLGLTLGILLAISKQSQILRQQDEIRDQKNKAELSRTLARRQRDEARRAVDEMYTGVARDWLSKQSNLQPVQRDLLQKALVYYREFASDEAVDPDVRARAALAFYRVGDIERRLGNLAPAERAFRQAIEALEALSPGKPGTPYLIEPLAGCYTELGELLDETGRTELSKGAFDRGIALLRELIDGTPDVPATASIRAAHFDELGTSLMRSGRNKDAEAAFQKAVLLAQSSSQPTSYTNAHSTTLLAVMLNNRGELAEAAELYREAVRQFDTLIKLEPGNPRNRTQLAGSLMGLGQTLANRKDDAEPILRRAADVFQTVASDAPEVPQYRRNLAATLLSLAQVLSNTGRLREAEIAAQRSRELLETLANESPTFVHNTELLAQSLVCLAKLRARTGELAIALPDAERAQELYAKLDPQSLSLRWERASNLQTIATLHERMGKFAPAHKTWDVSVAELEKLVAEAPARFDFRSDLAFNLMLRAESSTRLGHRDLAERDFERSVDVLKKVVKEAPERLFDRLRLAQALHHFASFLYAAGRLAECERFSRTAHDTYERLYYDHYEQDTMVRGCADMMIKIAFVQTRTGRLADAVDSYLRGAMLFDSLPPKLALGAQLRDSRAKCLDNAGACLLRLGKIKEAEPHIRQAHRIREGLAAEAPKEPGYQASLGLSENHLGQLLARRGETEASRTLLEQSVARLQGAVKADPKAPDSQAFLQAARRDLAYFFLTQGAYARAAAVNDDLIREHGADDDGDTAMIAASSLMECADQASKDKNQPAQSRQALALPYAKRALATYKLAAEHKDKHTATIHLAFFYLMCPAVELCDPREAIRLARGLTAGSPARADSWTTLGAAAYYCGNYQLAISAFDRARQLDSKSFGYWDFYVAIVESDLGHKTEAHRAYDRAEAWMKNNVTNKLHEQLHSQAASVLKLHVPVLKK
jgi:eukaryotic-like serine/threonine-protein kinase